MVPVRSLGPAPGSLRRWMGDRRGVAAVEMALATPVLLTLLCGTVQVAAFLNVQYQTAQMAATVADVVARYQTVTAADISAVFDVAGEVMGQKNSFAQDGTVFLSSVSKTGASDATIVGWQCQGGGALVQTSKVGKVGTAATLPGQLVLDAGDDVIVAEVYYNYSPFLSWLPISDTLVYKSAIFRPRLGALTTAPGC